MSKKSAFSNMCRTCMCVIISTSNSTKQQNIYEKPSGSGADCPNIMEILLSVQPQIRVEIKDNLPKIMCTRCIQQLQIAYNFVEMFNNTSETFNSILNNCETLSAATEKENHIPKFENPPAHNTSDEDFNNHYSAASDTEWSPSAAVSVKEKLIPKHEEKLPAHNTSDEDFDNPFSDASDSDWSPEDFGSKKPNLRQTSSRKSKPVLKSTIQNRSENNGVKNRDLKDAKDDEVLPPTNEDGSVSCQECKSVFDNIPQWREHMREHRIKNIHKSNDQTKKEKPKKSYECAFCGKVFTRIAPYKNHVRTHTGEKPYLCMECGKGFKIANCLTVHMRRHRGEKIVQCPQCPKKFVSSSALCNHMPVHTKEKTHVCEICGKAFQTSYHLKCHNVFHIGIKNFACEFCDKRFFTAELQRRHTRTHTGEKPYRCKYCDLSFAQSNDCNRHLKQHLGANIYQCELCPLRVPSAKDLREHFATHKDDDEETRARNLEARAEEQKNFKIKLGIKDADDL